MDIKYILYARKSTEDKKRQIQSIDDQVKVLTELASRVGLNVIDTITESKSAKDPDNRPGFTEMIEKIKKGEANGILCWKIDRLTRNPVEEGTIKWLLQKGIIQSIQTYEKEYIPEDNIILMGVESGMANQYILDLSKNVKRGSKSKAEKGWRPGYAPLGYKNDLINHTIIKDESRFDLVRKMWDLLLTGTKNPSQIIKMVNNEWGFTTPSKKNGGNCKLGISSLHWIFNNPFYYGKFEYPKKSGNWYQGKHDHMITEEEFEKAQIILGNKKKPRTSVHEFAFTGMIKCGHCGCSITADNKKKKVKSINGYKNYIYYHCTHKKPSIPCSQKPIKDTELEKQIISELGKYTIPQETLDWCLDVLKSQNESEQKCKEQEYSMLSTNYSSIQKKQKILIDMRLNNQIDDQTFNTRKEDFEKESRSLKSRLDNFQNSSENWLNQVATAFNFISHAKEAFINGTLQTKKDILTSFGKSLILQDGIIKIEANDWLVPISKLSFSSSVTKNTTCKNNLARTKKNVIDNKRSDVLYPSLSVGQGW